MEFVYLYDEIPKDLAENGEPLIDWSDHPEITRIINSTFSFYGSYKMHGQNRKSIKKRKYIKALWENGTWQYFRIKSVKKNLKTVSFTANHIGYEINRNFIQLSYTNRGNGKKIMNNLSENLAFSQKYKFESDVTSEHQFTAKEVNPIDAIIGQNNGNQNLAGVTGGELDMDNFTLNLKQRIGEDNGYSIDFGINLEAIEEFVDDISVVNSLYLIGGVPEDTDYDANQEPVKFSYLEVTGTTDVNRRIAKRENGDCKTVAELKAWGKSLFDIDRIHEPKATHEVNMIMLENTVEYQGLYGELAKLHFGDTAHCRINDWEFDIQERMIECVWIPTLKKFKSVVLGNDLGMYTSAVESSVNKMQQKLEIRTNEIMGAIVNATNWITGTKGGYVLMRPKNAPSEILIMDTPDPKTAKKVWRWNMGGLGFSSTGVDGEYGLAMTQDGAIVADFITAGTLKAIDIEGVNIKGSNIKGTNIEGSVFTTAGKTYQLRLKNGNLDIMDVKNDKSIGSLFSSANTETGELTGVAFTQARGHKFSLNTTSSKSLENRAVLEIPKESTAEEALLKTYASWTHNGSLEIKGSLIVNGIPITGEGGSGNGGGNWNGQYPPEVTTQAQKFAWQAWVTLLGMGYSPAAAAGILGNIQGEAGPSMNPDTEQVGGPAYGAIQFDGSSFPLIGLPTNNGREYFQRLHTASGVGGNYREMTIQMKVVNWTMTKGQWIGAVNPTSVDGFKNITSPETAAYAFEKNFERPANAHPEREGYAREWYNKFKDLKQPGGKYAMPVPPGYTITSWFGDRDDPTNPGNTETHKGMDFADASGTAIFASLDGVVSMSLAESESLGFGEYVVIRHADGNYTGYGHMRERMVTKGQTVTQGQQIGRMGSTGNSTGPHLHFSVGSGDWGPYQDPAPYLGLSKPS